VGDGRASEAVHAVVFGMARMSFNPAPADLMDASGGIERAPEIVVLHWFSVGGFPAVGFPSGEPLCSAVEKIAGISVNGDDGRAFQRFDGANCCGDFHSIVGRQRLAAGDFLFL